MSAWTPQETATLRRVYPFAGLEAVAALLPGRTAEGIRLKAGKLRIRSGATRKATGPKPKTADCAEGREPFVPPVDFLPLGAGLPVVYGPLRWSVGVRT